MSLNHTDGVFVSKQMHRKAAVFTVDGLELLYYIFRKLFASLSR